MGNIQVLENDILRVEIADYGAELSSIHDKRHGREVIWEADPAYWGRHAPLLFPNVGKHYKDAYRHEGVEYPARQHGFVRDREFLCAGKTDVSVTHRLQSDAESLKLYPFSFALEVTHELVGSRVIVKWHVENEDSKVMYFTIGGHPAFKVPILPDTKREDYYLLFDSKEQLDYRLIDPSSAAIAMDKTYPLQLSNSRCPIADDMFDKDALVFDDTQIEWVGIGYPDGSPYVIMRCEGFPNFGIWSKPGAPYVCLEPWIGRCDNVGFAGELSEKPGIIQLEVNGKFDARYEIELF